MNFTFYHLYPNLMNLYGSYANVLVLRRLLERMGHSVTVRAVEPGETVDFSKTDFLYMGAGTERRQRFAMEDLSRYGDRPRAAAWNGCPMLFAGCAMELLGHRVTNAEGESFAGTSIGNFTTVQGTKRIVGDVLGVSALPGAADPEENPPIVGFMNKSGIVADVTSPLISSLDMGFGNDREGGPEGYHAGNVFGSELTGPLLVKNPQILKAVAAAVLSHRGVGLPKSWPTGQWWPLDEWAVKGYEVTARELRARCQEA